MAINKGCVSKAKKLRKKMKKGKKSPNLSLQEKL